MIAALTAARVEPDAIADDYALGAERAHTHDPVLEEFLAERGTPSCASSSWSWPRASTSTGRRYVAGLLSSELQR